MIKEIQFKGYATEPSDYECSDGQLATSINLINEDEQIKPIFAPKQILDCNLGGVVITIHHVGNQDNYIILRKSDDVYKLYWLVKNDTNINEDSAVFIDDFTKINDLAIVGNVLVLATERRLIYILWKDDAYVNLGSKPPFVNISFGMTKIGGIAREESLNIQFEASPLQNVGGTQYRVVPSEENSNAIYGLLLSAIKDSITDKGYFYLPFFVRYAYRLYDGSYAWHSAPILMLCSVAPPFISAAYDANKMDENLVCPVTSSVRVNYFRLDYKIMDSIAVTDIEKWRDLISAIDVFISAPIYTYDQSKQITHITSYDSIMQSIVDYNDDESHILIGNYRRGDENFKEQLYEKHTNTNTYWKLTTKSIEDGIKNVNAFYKVASIPIEDIVAMDSYEPLDLDIKDMSTLVSRPQLTDDYQSHFDISAKHLLSYNNRLNIANVCLLPPDPFCPDSAFQATTSDTERFVAFTVYSRINNKLVCSAVGYDTHWDFTNSFPRYIYYPDANAFKMVINYNGKQYLINLKPHDLLNGAYWYGGLAVDPRPEVIYSTEGATSYGRVDVENKIYTSEVNNPFSFSPSAINTVGNGSITGIAVAAKALSQGQFGQFPLYAFSTEGVWALAVSSSGTYSTCQPITRDVCFNPDSITPIDSSVLFATDRGIMIISGSQSQCISDSIFSEAPFNVLDLPGVDSLHSKLGHPADACLPVQPFIAFLDGCRMVYDYVHQRIFVFNPSLVDGVPLYSYAYVFSLKSKMWGMFYTQLASVVNSYPDTMAMTFDNKLVSFSKTEESACKGLYITRPLKLDYPDVLKTVSSLVQRGHFKRGDVATVLYGSRDLYNWFLIWSSKDNYLRGFRGTPFKYFRIAGIANLSDGKSIFGISVNFETRHTNQLR